ncbi:T9SS type B sorting domain-containing protein [Crocinitomix catalasitica]|uniref:T9SS type B sorting domain-containing protein n=1 Tax=Crocinitomix catalasitica TaxID=184607 RepID=UPI000483D0F1|nr:gliding motility-associated C-terminal domain-containing protein [Crocinitomix catalasitica]
MYLKQLILILFIGFFAKPIHAAHLMGGEITWRALGGDNFEFTLVIYRDCNGLDIIDPSLDLRVWNHDVVTSIACDFLSSTDLSPDCSVVPGSPSEIDCGVGPGGGSGPGAIQKYVYRSAPILLTGTPPAAGWAFTYDSFSRNWDVDNITDPYAYGFTLSSIMYALPDGSCLDSSPQFAQDPYMLLCSGSVFNFDANAFDPDNDSLVFSWGVPLDHFPSGTFDPPTNPAPVPFEAGFAFNNPTPDASFDALNIPASMNTETGNIAFKSNTPGNFGFAQRIDCYRDGILIATINRESQLVVIPCLGYDNTAPTIDPPFIDGTFDAEFFAGDLINFDIVIRDMEVLQDGTPQTVTLIPTGNYFGTGLVDPASGCDYLPCATLDTPPIIQGIQGLTTNFNWQTSCDHLFDACGVQQQEQVYTFVLNAKDDYCTVPGQTYKTVRIKLKNRGEVAAPDLDCIDVLPSGDVVLNWSPPADPEGAFLAYEVWSTTDGFITTIPLIGTNTYTVVGAGADLVSKSYFIKTLYGCDGGNESVSDTLSSMFMSLNDLLDGRVRLRWNNTHDPIQVGEDVVQEIYREYPVGTWILRGTRDYGINEFTDTVDICEDFMSYEIRVNHDAGCTSTSNVEGAILKDFSAPDIPKLDWVSVNCETGFVDISWNKNNQSDTYGYIIFWLKDGIWEAIDTVYGIDNTTYSNAATEASFGPEGYRIAAFDSCYTDIVPPTYQTSALSEGHTTIFLVEEYDLCARTINLVWTPYEGWIEETAKYEVMVSVNDGPFELTKTITTAALKYNHTNIDYGTKYCFVVRATSVNDSISYSNKICRLASPPSEPDFHYLATATHTLGNDVELLLYSDISATVKEYNVIVKAPYESDFVSVTNFTSTVSDFMSIYDENVFPERGAYQYQINIIDTCGNIGQKSNLVTTSFLEITTDHVEMKHTLSWTSYYGFDGNVKRYNIYRGENGVFDDTPIATTLPGVRSFVDDVSEFINSQGQFCYRVEAVETINSYGFSETSFSNTACAVVEPLVYIPNAFVVNGANPVFLPVVSLYEFDSYQLQIYNRWGEIIFQSDDPYEGWDGYNNVFNRIHEEGMYVYFLAITDRNAKEYQFRGTVALLIGGQ